MGHLLARVAIDQVVHRDGRLPLCQSLDPKLNGGIDTYYMQHVAVDLPQQSQLVPILDGVNDVADPHDLPRHYGLGLHLLLLGTDFGLRTHLNSMLAIKEYLLDCMLHKHFISVVLAKLVARFDQLID